MRRAVAGRSSSLTLGKKVLDLSVLSLSRFETVALLMAAIGLAVVEVRRRRYGSKLSRMAVFSACWAVTNPLWMDGIVYPDQALGDIELRAWIAGTIAAATGIVALCRLRLVGSAETGRFFAWIGVTVGATISIGGVVVLILFALGMSKF